MKMGLVIAGSITTAAGGLMIFTGYQQEQEDASNAPDTQQVDDMNMNSIWYIYGGIHLAVGIPLLAVGLLSEKDVYVRDEASLQVDPQLAPGFAGGRLRWAF